MAATYNLLRDEIIREALSILRVATDGEPITEDVAADAARSFNIMVKAWMADGLHLWCKTEGVVFLTQGTERYTLGPDSFGQSCRADDLTETNLFASVSAGVSAIVVVDNIAPEIGDPIGVGVEEYQLFWTTIAGYAGGVVTLTDPLPTPAAVDAPVFTYPAGLTLPRPVRLLQARRRQYRATDVPLDIVERPDYFSMADKANRSTVTMTYYDPQLTNGYLYVWAPTVRETDTLRLTYERPLADMDDTDSVADFPQEWTETLVFNLADRLASKYAYPLQERALLRADAETMREKLLNFDREFGSMFFQPDNQRGMGFDADNYGYYRQGRR